MSINYDNYFNEISKKEESSIDDVFELLKTFQKYLDTLYISLESLRDKKQEDLNEVIRILQKYMNIIYDYYFKISIQDISQNIDINYHFVDTMTIAIIILYSYIYYNNIYTIRPHKVDTISFKYTNSIFTFIMNRIIYNCYNINIIIKKDELLFKFKDIIYTEEPKCRKFMEQQTAIITDFINKISIFYKIKPSNKRYFTIPKYTGICWFVSFIVGICYGDKNKQLILNKKNINDINYKKQETDISKLSANEIFTTLIYRIIYEITEKRKTYNDIDETTMNELNIYLKKTPIQFLIKLVNEYFESSNKETFSHEYSFIKNYIINKNYKTPLSIDEYDKLGNFGINDYNYFFLNLLYRFLNINSLYLIKAVDKFYSYDIENKDPDVILINTTTNKYAGLDLMKQHNIFSTNINYIDITKEITYYNPVEIIYNGNKYEIDYILYGSDTHNSWNGIGHAIVALNYNNEDYFYDSRFYINEYTYKDNKLRYSCPLIKKEWKKDFSLNNSRFCLKKCFHSEIKERSKLYLDAKDLTEDNICYMSNTDIVCCYVKETKIEGGNNDYKITKNKIEIIIKNKKYIRNIYINSKNKKYIKFNNEYILLSNKTYLKTLYSL